MIIETANRLAALMGRRDAFECFDQPIFNYILLKTRPATGVLAHGVVESHMNHLPPLTNRVGKGFVHFSGGVGNAVRKITYMITYFEALRRGANGGA